MDVENRVYKVMTALVAPSEATLARDIGSPYRPFDHIDRIRVPTIHGSAAGHLDLIPLAIFDDAHVLHPEQFRAFEQFLVRRELRIARWIIARFDVLLPEEALAAVIEDRSDAPGYPGVSAERETELILFQSSGRRRKQRERFRTLAKDMATRYLRRMPMLNDKGLTVLGNVLGESDVGLTPARLRELEERVNGVQQRLRVPSQLREAFEAQIRDYWGDKSVLPPAMALAMLSVMLHRFSIRRSRGTPTLFDSVEDVGVDESDSSIAVAANGAVYEAAVFQLFHGYGRPYYFGIDNVCDASSENAELFLWLAAELVEAVATQLARAKPPTLSPATQHKLLRERGGKIMEKWDFPQEFAVRRLVQKIADLCLKKSLEPNGAVIANALGVPQAEVDNLAKTRPQVARALQFAVAYNAITLVAHHSCKNKEWCLLELGGAALLKYGLTLKRGGFIEGTAAQLSEFVEESFV